MRKLTSKERKILQDHRLWLDTNGRAGARADLRDADLRDADLRGADLAGADLEGADLRRADLTRAILTGGSLMCADLRGATLRRADLEGADLRRAGLTRAILTGANLRGTNLDFAAWPLHCGACDAIADDRLVAQLAYHLTRLDVSGCSGGVREAVDHLRAMALSDLFCEYRFDVEVDP